MRVKQGDNINPIHACLHVENGDIVCGGKITQAQNCNGNRWDEGGM